MNPSRAQVGLYRGSVAGLVVALVGVVSSAWIWPVVDEVETGKTETYAELVPRYFSADPARVIEESGQAFDTLAAFELISSQAEMGAAKRSERHLRGRVGSVWSLFDAEIDVWVVAVTPFVTEVSVRSTTPSVPGDFGQNSRNIVAFYDELERRIGALRFMPKTTEPEAGR
jgi:hypothetical protein